MPVRMPSAVLSLALLLVLAGCGPSPTGAADLPKPELAAESAPEAVERVAPTPGLDAFPFAAALAVGTPYAEARTALLTAGWRPIITAACAENVGGKASVCRELPELEACSGTGAGYCLMAFGSVEGMLAVSLRTTGGHANWAATGEAATMRIDRAELATLASPVDRTCASSDFMTFLETFAADPTVRAAWTAPLVRVALRYDLGEDSVEVAGLQRAAEFTGFPVVHQGEAFHHVDASGALDGAPLALRITEPDADTRDVAFDYGMSEGNRVRFTRSGACWQLVEDPEPPSP